MYPGGFNCLNDPEAPSGGKLDSFTDDDLFGVVKKVVCICIGVIVVVMLFTELLIDYTTFCRFLFLYLGL